jgi:hypothetical protein
LPIVEGRADDDDDDDRKKQQLRSQIKALFGL